MQHPANVAPVIIQLQCQRHPTTLRLLLPSHFDLLDRTSSLQQRVTRYCHLEVSRVTHLTMLVRPTSTSTVSDPRLFTTIANPQSWCQRSTPLTTIFIPASRLISTICTSSSNPVATSSQRIQHVNNPVYKVSLIILRIRSCTRKVNSLALSNILLYSLLIIFKKAIPYIDLFTFTDFLGSMLILQVGFRSKESCYV